MIGLGVGIWHGITGRREIKFSPLSLFSSGEQGAWYDPSDLSTLFQDSAGVIPVTAAGQPVGLMRDKSGSGNHASQVTSTMRPILRNSGALWWLQFDGIDDFLFVADNQGLKSSKMSLFIGVNPLALSSREDWFSSGNSVGYSTNNYTVGNSSVGIQLLPRTPASTIALSAISASAPIVVSVISDNAQSLVQTKINGIQAADKTATFGTDNTAGFFIGKSSNGSPSGMYLFGMIARGASTLSADKLSTEKYLAAKSGVTI